MKVRVYYDKKHKDYVDPYTMYFPYSKKIRDETKKSSGHLIMGTALSFNCHPDGSMTLFSWFDDDRDLGYNIPNCGDKKIKIETLPKGVQDYVAKMEKIWSDANKYDDKKHWDAWNNA